jgi:hypothetical protein
VKLSKVGSNAIVPVPVPNKRVQGKAKVVMKEHCIVHLCWWKKVRMGLSTCTSRKNLNNNNNNKLNVNN